MSDLRAEPPPQQPAAGGLGSERLTSEQATGEHGRKGLRHPMIDVTDLVIVLEGTRVHECRLHEFWQVCISVCRSFLEHSGNVRKYR